MTRCDGDCYLCTGNRCRRDPAPSPHEGEAARCDECGGDAGEGVARAIERIEDFLTAATDALLPDEEAELRSYFATVFDAARQPAPSPHEGEAARGDRCPSCDSRHWNIQIVAGKPVDRGWVGPLHRCRDEWHRVNNPAHRETAPSEARLRERMDELIEAVREWAAAEWPGGVKQASQFDADDRDRRVLVALAALASTPNPEERCGKHLVQAGNDGYCTRSVGHGGSCIEAAPDPTPEPEGGTS